MSGDAITADAVEDSRPALLAALARQHNAWRQLLCVRADRVGDPTVQVVLQVRAEGEFDVATDQLQHLLDGWSRPPRR